jgi:SAM-dependent methyltransferase
VTSAGGLDRTTGPPERAIDPDWLRLREPADAQARDGAASSVLSPLLARLRGGPERGLRIVDLGSGTGANLRWLAPRLPRPDRQHWTLIDHDERLLARGFGMVPSTAVRADVTELGSILADLGRADLVTAAALLDLLDRRQLTAIIDAVVAGAAPALFSLSVTGEVRLDPPDRGDGPIAAAFDAHQRRGGRFGPDAGPVVADLFRARGWSVLDSKTPWELRSSADPELIKAWLDGRAAAASEQQQQQQPGPNAATAGWLDRRRTQLTGAGLSAWVGHVDVLALPPD